MNGRCLVCSLVGLYVVGFGCRGEVEEVRTLSQLNIELLHRGALLNRCPLFVPAEEVFGVCLFAHVFFWMLSCLSCKSGAYGICFWRFKI